MKNMVGFIFFAKKLAGIILKDEGIHNARTRDAIIKT